MKFFLLLSAGLVLISCATTNDNVTKAASANQAAQPIETAANATESSTSERLKDGEVLTEKSKKKKSSKRICKYDATVTSRIKRKTCRTQAEWDYIEQETQREVDRMKRRNTNQGRGGASLPGGM